MTRRREGQRAFGQVVLFGLLGPRETLLDPALRRIDGLLDDEALVDAVWRALRRRYPQSARRGRPATPAEVVLRLLVLKHLKTWSYEQLEWEVRGSVAYRHFCRLGGGTVPDGKTLVRLGQLPEGGLLRAVLERGLLRITRRVVRETQRSVTAARRQLRRLPPAAQRQARRALTRVATMLPRVQQVVRQTRGRIVHGVTTGADKLVSLFEPSAQILRRGKLHRPTEFGALVKVQETEGGIVTEVGVVDGKNDAPLLVPAVEGHGRVFGRPPGLVAGGRGFYFTGGERRGGGPRGPHPAVTENPLPPPRAVDHQPAPGVPPARRRGGLAPHLGPRAGGRRADLVLHLHGLDEEGALAALARGARLDQHGDDLAGHRRPDLARAVDRRRPLMAPPGALVEEAEAMGPASDGHLELVAPAGDAHLRGRVVDQERERAGAGLAAVDDPLPPVDRDPP